MKDNYIRTALDRHWAASAAGDLAAEHDIYHDDSICDYPQSGERIRGRANLQALRGHHPSKPAGFTVRRITGTGDIWVTEYTITYGGPAGQYGEHHGVQGRQGVPRNAVLCRSIRGPCVALAMGRADGVRMPPDTRHIRRLRRAELPIDTVEMARYLIGKTLVHNIVEGRMSGRIVETEAYVVGDASGHAFHGPTSRNRSLYLERGHAYVYFVYGSSYLLNVTSELPGVGAGVLLRALEPLEGIGLMQAHRRYNTVA